MLQLLKQELYKIFSRRILYISLIALLLIVYVPYYIISSKDISENYGSSKELYNYFNPHEGLRDENNYNKVIEKIEYYSNEGKDTKEAHSFHMLVGEYSSQTKPRLSALSDIFKRTENPFVDTEGRLFGGSRFDFEAFEINELKETIDKLAKIGKENTYEYKNKALAYNMYMKVDQRKLYYVEAWNNIISTSKMNVFILAAMILIGISPVFAGEYETKMSSLIFSSKKGQGQGIWAKILASIIYAVVITLIINLSVTFVMIKIHGTYGFNSPLQCLFQYRCSPYKLTINQFWIISILTSILGAVIFTLLILFLSSLSRSSLMTFFTAGFIFAVPVIIEDFIARDATWQKTLLNLSINRIMKGSKPYEVFYSMNVFGRPLLYPYFIVIYSILLINLFTYAVKKGVRYQDC